MAEHQAGTSFQYESDDSVIEIDVDSPVRIDEDDSVSSDEHALMITDEIMHYVLSKDRKIYWMLNPFITDEEETLTPSRAFVSTPNIYSVSGNTDVRSLFRLFLNHSIADTIVMTTNKHGRKLFGNNWPELTQDILEAYIGLQLLGRIFQGRGEPIRRLWNAGTGRQIFRLAMPLKMFLQITRALNFEGYNPAEGNNEDPLAPVRDIWDQWMQLLPKYYYPGNDVCISEQIIGFRGDRSVEHVSSRKSSPCGIKIHTLSDSETSYVLKIQICESKSPGEKLEKDEHIQGALRLTQGLQLRNVNCSSVFTSYQLGQLLLRRKLTMLGLITNCTPELPTMEPDKELHSSDFYFTEDTTLLHYVPKKNQPVYLLSTKHKKRQINDKDKEPLIYTEYANKKKAIDELERGLTLFSCNEKTKYTAGALLNHMIDVSVHNALILYSGIYPALRVNKVQKKRMFMEDLGKALILPYMSSRSEVTETEEAMALLRQLQEKAGYDIASTGSETSAKKFKCKHCPKKNVSKTFVKCASCKKYLCRKHTVYVCSGCKK